MSGRYVIYTFLTSVLQTISASSFLSQSSIFPNFLTLRNQYSWKLHPLHLTFSWFSEDEISNVVTTHTLLEIVTPSLQSNHIIQTKNKLLTLWHCKLLPSEVLRQNYTKHNNPFLSLIKPNQLEQKHRIESLAGELKLGTKHQHVTSANWFFVESKSLVEWRNKWCSMTHRHKKGSCRVALCRLGNELTVRQKHCGWLN